MDKFVIEGSEIRNYLVKRFGGGSGHIILPKDMIGKKVKVIFLEEEK